MNSGKSVAINSRRVCALKRIVKKKKKEKKVNFQISLKLPNKLYTKPVSVEGLLCSLINDIY